MKRHHFRAIVVGGSVGGLAAALELRRSANADVAVYERSAGLMQAHGAGIVMQPDVAWLLEQYGTNADAVCVWLQERVHLNLDGTSLRQHAPQLMTAWDTLYKAMREPLGDICYRQDSELVRLEQEDGHVRVRFADGYETSGDFLVAADGINSECRTIFLGKTTARYAGYVAWRGLEAEQQLPAALVSALADRFTLYHTNGMQMLCYLVPGVDGETRPGGRRVNWVWYINTPEEALTSILTGGTGHVYRSFVPAGEVSAPNVVKIQALADASLPPVFRELVKHSQLFLQPVQDVTPQPRLHGHCALIGDAAGTVRPHTAAGTSKAFADATLLARALEGWMAGQPLPLDRLKWWERQRQGDLIMTSQMGMRLAASSGLGIEGGPQPWTFEH